MWGFGIRSGVACGDLGSVMGIWGRLWGAASLLGSAVGFITGFWGHLWGLGSALKTEVGGGGKQRWAAPSWNREPPC